MSQRFQFTLKTAFIGVALVAAHFMAPLAYWSAYGSLFLLGELIGIGFALLAWVVVMGAR